MKRYIGRGLVQRSFCPHRVLAPAWCHVEVLWYLHLEVLQAPSLWAFVKASLHWPMMIH